MNKRVVVGLALLSLSLVACGNKSGDIAKGDAGEAQKAATKDQKEASEENFTVALNNYYKTAPACEKMFRILPPMAGNGNYGYIYDNANHAAVITLHANEIATNDVVQRFKDFKDAGLFTEADGPVKEANVSAYIRPYMPKEQTVTFAATEIGKKYIDIEQDAMYICPSGLQVAKVVNFTEPGDMAGKKVSQVTYTVKANGVADWAKNPSLAKHIFIQNLIKSDKDGTFLAQGKKYLELTHNGWQVSSDH